MLLSEFMSNMVLPRNSISAGVTSFNEVIWAFLYKGHGKAESESGVRPRVSAHHPKPTHGIHSPLASPEGDNHYTFGTLGFL